MKVHTEDLGKLLISKIKKASKVRIAVAYFSPNDEMQRALRSVSDLILMSSDEFWMYDASRLEDLSKVAKVRCVRHESSKLHAKVFCCYFADGTKWALVGSANFTYHGLFKNREVCVELDSESPIDSDEISKLNQWMKELWKSGDSYVPDWEQAKSMYKGGKTKGRKNMKNKKKKSSKSPDPNGRARRYWALKCTSGAYGENHWEKFLTEDVVAIGWSGLKHMKNSDPSNHSYEQIKSAVSRTYRDKPGPGKDPYTPGQVVASACTIHDFANEMDEEDLVLLCRGYAGNQNSQVQIYGYAKVGTLGFRNPDPSWGWRFVRDAEIQIVNLEVPVKLMRKCLGKDSLRSTIHELDEGGLKRLAQRLERNYGVSVDAS